MSAVLNFPSPQGGDVYLEMERGEFDAYFERTARTVLLATGVFHPEVSGAVRIVEVAGPSLTGREVYGTITALHRLSTACLVHFDSHSRTWDMPNKQQRWPNQNKYARYYFGLEDKNGAPLQAA